MNYEPFRMVPTAQSFGGEGVSAKRARYIDPFGTSLGKRKGKQGIWGIQENGKTQTMMRGREECKCGQEQVFLSFFFFCLGMESDVIRMNVIYLKYETDMCVSVSVCIYMFETSM